MSGFWFAMKWIAISLIALIGCTILWAWASAHPDQWRDLVLVGIGAAGVGILLEILRKVKAIHFILLEDWKLKHPEDE